MDADIGVRIAWLVNGIGLSVIIWVIMYLITDAVRERWCLNEDDH
jgi:hypothetical protein